MSALSQFLIDPSLIPANRRGPHQRALQVIDAYERTGAPFALMLQSYKIMQIFRYSERDIGDHLENLLADEMPMGVGFLEVQPRGALAEIEYPEKDSELLALARLEIYAPSLVLDDETWLEAVTHLIRRAEMIVVVLTIDSPGLVSELEVVAASGRADRTVVLFSELIGDPMPFLDQFPRVLSMADLERKILKTFVFTDLFERLWRIHNTPSKPEPISTAGLETRFESLALSARGERRSRAAARYFSNATRLALLAGDRAAAVRLTAAQTDCLSKDEARAAVGKLFAAVGELSRDDPAQVLIHARLVILSASLEPDPTGSVQLLDAEYERCLKPPHRQALSALRTARAWKLRLKRDAEGVMEAAREAFDLAREENARLEMARALFVIGVTCHELGDLPAAGSALQRACDVFPRDQAPEDLCLILIRLAAVIRDAGHPDEARALLNGAIKLAVAKFLPQEEDLARGRLAELDGRSRESAS